MEGILASASGVISLEISRNPATFILFFRPEITETVKWGGDPSKPVIVDEESARLSPRKSFKLWKEDVRGSAQPWTEAEIRMASELKKLVLLVGAKGSGGVPNLSAA
jgi:two-component system, chemotaxis family, sensor kinase Cph1